MLDTHFPEQKATVKTTDKPWLTPYIKKLMLNRKKELKKHGKSDLWRQLNKKCRSEVSKRKERYYKERVEKLEKKDNKMWYSIVRGLMDAEKTNVWSPKDLFPGMNMNDVAETYADHFSAISQDFPHLELDGIRTNMTCNVSLLEHDEFNNLKGMKIPDSTVPGDLPKKVLKEFLPLIVTPITHIYNEVLLSKVWPLPWRKETVIPIPKVANPGSLSQVRNISLTNFLSKGLEKIFLAMVHSDIKKNLSKRQFGAKRGIGVTHALVELWDKILTTIDSSDKRAVICGYYLSKAFLKQNHNDIIRAYKSYGLSEWKIQLVASFLSKRDMVVRVGDILSSPREMPGGSPQGSTFGQDTFITNTNHLGLMLPLFHTCYIDDITTIEVVTTEDAICHFSEAKPIREYHLKKSERCLEILGRETSSLGMSLNATKTVLMPFSDSRVFDEKFVLKDVNGDHIEEKATVKILGFTFGKRPTVQYHVEEIRKKCYKRIWMLRHLKRNGVTKPHLVKIYISMLRSVIDFATPAYCTMLTQGMRESLERIQKMSLRIIYGFEHDYESLLNLAGLESIQERMSVLVKNFIENALKTHLGASWFPKKIYNRESRSDDMYEEVSCATERCLRSPLFKFRRILNEKKS